MRKFRLYRYGSFVVSAIAIGWFCLQILPRWFPLITRSAWGSVGLYSTTPLPSALADLPLLLIDSGDVKSPLAIMLCGNYGWWEIDDVLARVLAEGGVTTIGFNSLSYFVYPRTPEETARDIERIIAVFDERREVILVGYSFGADIVATVFQYLKPEARKQIKTISLLGLSHVANYSIGFWKISSRKEPTPTAISAIRGPRIQCFRGLEEGDRSACGLLDRRAVDVIDLPGGHHFDGNYADIAQKILKIL